MKALREKLEQTEVALRKKSEEVEEAYRVFREVTGMPATPQRAPESDKSQQDYRRPDTPITPPERSYTGYRGDVPYVYGNPQNRADEAWEEHLKRSSRRWDQTGEWYSG